MAKAKKAKKAKKADNREPATYVPTGGGKHYNLRVALERLQNFREALNDLSLEDRLEELERNRLLVERNRVVNGVQGEPRLSQGIFILMCAMVGLTSVMKQWGPPGWKPRKTDWTLPKAS